MPDDVQAPVEVDQAPGDSLTRRRVSFAVHAVVIAVLLVAQLVVPRGVASLLMLGAIYCIYALGYEYVFSFTNQTSLGQSLFFGGGAYTVALLVQRLHVNFLLATLFAVVVAIVLGVVIGFITVRLTEAYFVITTALFATVAHLVGTDLTWLTGGSNGLPFEIPPAHIFGLSISVYDTRLFYYMLIVTILMVYLVTQRVRKAKLGLVWNAVKENENRVPFLGYNLFRYKLTAFIVAAALTGLSGALYALRLRYVTVDYLSLKWSIIPIVWVLLGGSGTVIGPILGVVIMIIFEYYVSGIFVNYMLIVGALLMVLMRWSPNGLVGYLMRIPSLWRGGRAKGANARGGTRR